MNKKIVARVFDLILVLLCTLPIVSVMRPESRAKCKEVKTITIEKGKTYKLRYGKGYTYKSTKPKIVCVSKKAVIKAKKKGKCVVKVRKGRKMINYKVKVVNKLNNTSDKNAASVPDEKEQLQPTPSAVQLPVSTPTPTCAPGGYIALGRGTIISINKTDDSSYECMVELAKIDMENLKGKFKDCPDVQYVICKCMKNYEVNTGVSIIVNQNEYLSNNIVKDEKTIELTCEHFF